jgi:iron(III) transport system substrate-binding protein
LNFSDSLGGKNKTAQITPFPKSKAGGDMPRIKNSTCIGRGSLLTRALVGSTLLGAIVLGLSLVSARAAEKIVVYTVLPEVEVNRQINDEFTRRTGIDVEMLSIPAVGTVASRIRSEKAKPRADVFAAATVDFQEALAKEGLLLAYKSPLETTDIVNKGYSDPNGFWHGWFGQTTAIFWNRNRFDKDIGGKGGATPAIWEDLLNPAYKGQLILANPQTSAIGYVLLATQIFRLGEDKAWDYTRKLNESVKQYTPSAPLTVTLVEQGEGTIGAFWLSDILTSKIGRKQPIDFVVPLDNVVSIWAASIINGGPNPEGAKKYIDFLLSDYPQSINAKFGFRNPLNPKVAPPEGAPTLADLKTVRYDLPWAMENMDRVRKEWSRMSDR